jgi:hypothetical protein
MAIRRTFPPGSTIEVRNLKESSLLIRNIFGIKLRAHLGDEGLRLNCSQNDLTPFTASNNVLPPTTLRWFRRVENEEHPISRIEDIIEGPKGPCLTDM